MIRVTDGCAPATLFDVGNVFPLVLRDKSFTSQLARASGELFCDRDFEALYDPRIGRPCVSPAKLALLLLLQAECGCSDAETVERSGCDLRWAAVLGVQAGSPFCAKSTLQLFRGQLIINAAVGLIFRRSIEEARRKGLLKGEPLRVALDTKPIEGRGAVEDTYNLLGTGIRKLCRALAATQKKRERAWALRHDFGRYFRGSLKGSAAIDWSDSAARQEFLLEVVTDARRLLRLAEEALTQENCAIIRDAADLLSQLLLQDIEEKTTAGGQPEAEIKQGTPKGRIPSATDPEQRHGRKSKSKRFNGHKAAIGVDIGSSIIVDADVLPGDAGDASEASEQIDRAQENTGLPVEATIGDCAYGGGETRQQFADQGRALIAKVPQPSQNNGLFPKSAFDINLHNNSVTCPQGHTASAYNVTKDGGKQFSFGAHCKDCPLRQHCTEAAGGRSVTVHPQEELLMQARAYQETPEGKAALRERQVVEHRLARLGQLGIGQARYVGRAKVRFQLLMAASVANLRLTWNWEGKRAANNPKTTPFPSFKRFLTNLRLKLRTTAARFSPPSPSWTPNRLAPITGITG